MIPSPEPGVGSPPRSKSQSKSEQMIITQPYIWHAKQGMTCPNDVRATSLKDTHHTGLQAQETSGGKWGTLTRQASKGPNT